MRMARPFDREGNQLSYSVQGIDNDGADLGARGSLVGSWTGEKFGILVGFAGMQNNVATSGFETVGWTSLNLTQAQCGGWNRCPAIPPAARARAPGSSPTVPNNPSTVGAGLTPGATIDNAFLLAQNPGRTIQQIDNALIPRLGRPMFDEGSKDRYNSVVSLEFRPSDDLKFFLDSMYGKKDKRARTCRHDVGHPPHSQGGLVIPQNMEVDREDCATGCVVTSATYANSLFMLEYRPYTEELEFWGTNPGMEWQIADKWKLEVQGNYTESDFYRESPDGPAPVATRHGHLHQQRRHSEHRVQRRHQ